MSRGCCMFGLPRSLQLAGCACCGSSTSVTTHAIAMVRCRPTTRCGPATLRGPQLIVTDVGQTMLPRDVVSMFLKGSLHSRWRDRYVGFVAKPKTEAKLLRALPHDLMSCFDQRAIVTELADSAWNSPALSFSTEGFGLHESSLRSAHARCGDSVLVVTCDGKYEFHREEDLHDSELLLAARVS